MDCFKIAEQPSKLGKRDFGSGGEIAPSISNNRKDHSIQFGCCRESGPPFISHMIYQCAFSFFL